MMSTSTTKRRLWTEDEIAFVKANPQMKLSELGEKLGRCKASLNKIRSKLGISSDFHTPWSEEEKRVAEANLHLSNKELAKLLGRTTSSVSSARKWRGQRMQRTCVMCNGIFVSQNAPAKVCSTCNPSGKGDSNNPLVRMSYYTQGARDRGLPFDLTPVEFFSFWQKPCTYCNSKIETIGLDRVDPKLGYSMSNVVPCCSRCNEMKNNATVEQWIADMKSVLKHLGEI
jgi:hypothetical protein